ncbi:MAG: hypothetical protein AAF726_06250 [Planctomycetota bacterium]
MKSSSLALLFLLVGIVVGAAIGVIAADRGPSVAAASATVDREVVPNVIVRDAPTRDRLADVAAPDAVASSEDAADRVIQRRARAATNDIASRVAATVPDDVEGADAVLRGRVVGEDGEPLAGVTVVTEGGGEEGGDALVRGRSTNDVGRGWTGPDSIDDSLEWRARRFLEERRTLRTAKSDTDGEFELTGLRPGRHRLRAYLEGYVFDSDRFYTGQRGWLVGRPVGLFHLDLRLPDGTQPAEAVVDLVGERDVYRWTPDEPVLRLEERLATFRALGGAVQELDRREYASDLASDELTIDLARDGEGPHVIQLDERDILRITVMDESGLQPPIDPWVKIAPARDVQGRDPAAAFRDVGYAEETDDESAWIKTDVAPGSYVIAVGRSARVPEVVETIEVAVGANAHEVVLGAFDMGKFLVVRCAGPQGQPLKEVEFDRLLRYENGGSDGGTRSEERGPGEYWLPLDGLLSGRSWSDVEQVTLVAEADGYGKLTSEVPIGAESLALTFQPSCDLTVFVEGDRSPGFSVSAVNLSEDENQNRWGWGGERATIDSRGLARLRGLQPGEVRVFLRRSGGGRRPTPAIATQDVLLRGGEQQVTFIAPTFHDVVVRASGLEARTRMRLRADGGGGFRSSDVRLNEDGVATFRDVPAGQYLLSARGNNRAPMSISVPSGEIVYEAQVINAFLVTRVTSGGFADRSGLRDGDVVHAINDRPVDADSFYDRLRLYLQDGTVTLSVDRGNGTAEVRIGPLKGEGGNIWSQIGARFEPRAR